MAREIKFRGKSIDSPIEGLWVYGDLLQCNDGDVQIGIHGQYIDDGYHFNSNWDKCVNIDDETMGQFTGLLDKNGKEIYEGDIVIFDNHLQGISQVVYDYAGFDVDSKNYRTALRPMMNNHIRVIGNIHDNPELLKGGVE